MKGKKKNAWLGDFMCNVIGGTREYHVNKITYIVEARCRPIRADGNMMPQEKFAKLIKNSSAHLTEAEESDKIEAEYVLESAGKEDYADQNQTE